MGRTQGYYPSYNNMNSGTNGYSNYYGGNGYNKNGIGFSY